MKLYYVTLNTSDEAREIGRALLEQQLAVCANWFPITCAYRWEGEITEESEVVLIVKTQPGLQGEIEKAIRDRISYNNFIAEISPSYVNQSFLGWLDREVPARSLHKAERAALTDLQVITRGGEHPTFSHQE